MERFVAKTKLRAEGLTLHAIADRYPVSFKSVHHIVTGATWKTDEFVAHNATVHVECMGGPQWWIGVTLEDGRSWMINIGGANPNAKGFGICEADQ